MGVDQKRPLAGFALVAVLCAVLMTLSVSRGWGLDLIHPGRPIVSAGQAEKAPHDRRATEPTADVTTVSVPVELSAQPLGTANGAVARAAGSHARPVHATGGSVSAVRSTGDDDEQAEPEVEHETTPTEHDAVKAQRQAEREAAKAERDAAKAARQAEHAAVKAAREAEREAAKAQREAEREAAKAQREAAQAARQAEHDAAKAARAAERAAEKAARDAEREAAQAARQAERDAAKAARDAERQAADAARDAQREAAEAARDAAKAARHP